MPSGINAATRELGIDRTEAQRAMKIDRLTDEAKQGVHIRGLKNNNPAGLVIALAGLAIE